MSTQPKKTNKAYATVWRWHFYTGLFIAPFLIALSLTGLGMLLFANIDGRHGEMIYVSAPTDTSTKSLTVQTQAVTSSFPNAEIAQYISPKKADQVAIFKISEDKKTTMVAVNPYTAEIVQSYPKDKGLYALMDDIHGDLLIGDTGDYLLEAAASLTILMIVSGWYLWWLNQKSLRASLFPDLSRQKTGGNKKWWKNAHGATGAWVSILLFFFLISGLSWAGIWGGKMVQAWSQFPSEKWGKPESTLIAQGSTHGEALNPEGPKEVPWVLEQTPMPTSTVPEDKTAAVAITEEAAHANHKISSAENLNKGTVYLSAVSLIDGKVTLEGLESFAKQHTIEGRYQLNFPKGETGVWTVSQDSMSYDSNSPTADRTIHIDQYSGEVLADVKYTDYNFIGKFMAVGIALHMGTLGLWSILANALFCLAIIFMCLGSLVMWWKRRPTKAVGLVPPPNKKTYMGKGLAVVFIITAACFPLALVAIVAIFLLDFLVISRVPKLQHWFQ